MDKIILKHQNLKDDALFDIFNRDAVLWVGADLDESDTLCLARLMTLPWKMVLCESSSDSLWFAVSSSSHSPNLILHRGFIHPVAADPINRQLPSRALPIYFLNGYDGAPDKVESSTLQGMSGQRRRLNMIEKLQSSNTKRVILVGQSPLLLVEQIEDLWANDFRSMLTLVVQDDTKLNDVEDRLKNLIDISSISIVLSSIQDFAINTVTRCEAAIPDKRIILRVKNPMGEVSEVDITEAELIEQPILDEYEVIRSRDLRLLSESDLNVEDIDNFFGRRAHSWKPYAASLPWIYDASCELKLLKALERSSKDSQEPNKIFYIVSEAGAGGTTLANHLAFKAALSGYPVLIARPELYEPNPTAIISFLNRTRKTLAANEEYANENTKDLPWLLVFDRNQWDGLEGQINTFVNEFTRSGRSVVVLKVVDSSLPENLPNGNEIAHLTHDLNKHQAIDLGIHLNRFLRPFGRSKTESEWQAFWEQHRPDIDTSIAAFWVALDFWLRGLIEIGESLQAWLLREFKNSPVERDVKLILLEIAALTIERRSIPESLIPNPQSSNLPLSILLEKLRTSFPALSLVRQTTVNGRYWAMAHDVIGRYLITACYYDSEIMKSLRLESVTSPEELRLHLISNLAKRADLGDKRYYYYAIQFAVKTLKLDDEGNAEFFRFWRQVLGVLESFPQSVKDTSRIFNHHVAISRRRVAKGGHFEISEEEKKYQLEKAVHQIEFALDLDTDEDDESDANLYNSLALAYQDLASLESSLGASPEIIAEFRLKANAATHDALKINPMNSYVLETAAKNLIQQAGMNDVVMISSAAESLGYIFQAAKLDGSNSRQYHLEKLANDAIAILRESGAGSEIDKMCSENNAMGFLAKAWLELTNESEYISNISESRFSHQSANNAFEILAAAPRHWLIIKQQYDILCNYSPSSYSIQLQLLDELSTTTTYRLPLQLRLNRAILLHINGRHPEGNSMFKQLRHDIKSGNEIVAVPDNLRWLVNSDGVTRLICTARVFDGVGYRSAAQVSELKNALVPFIPQDFGERRMQPGTMFKCNITFGAMGPFIKPPLTKN